MKISSLLLGFITAFSSVSQGAEMQAVIRRVYHGNDFRGYYMDPPCWRFYPRPSCHSKSSHWLYENHRQVFIEITIDEAAER